MGSVLDVKSKSNLDIPAIFDLQQTIQQLRHQLEQSQTQVAHLAGLIQQKDHDFQLS
jgi:hypothetical protein